MTTDESDRLSPEEASRIEPPTVGTVIAALAKWAASRKPRAVIVRVGFAWDPVGITAPPLTYRLAIPKTLPLASTTPCRSEAAIRAVPTWC